MERFILSLPDEDSLIASARAGNLEAFNDLILLHQDFLFNLAARTIGDDDRAEDAVQEALISAFRSLRTFHGGSFRAWLARAVINKCYDEFRRTSRHPSVPLTPVFDGEEMEDWGWLRDPSPSLQSQIEADELGDALQRCLASLPFVHRSVLALVDVDGFTYEETAATLQIPVGTVKSRLARARAAMRAALGNVSELLPSVYQNFHAVPA
ncbi:MAG: RNA polymerase sigma factor [Chloroflexi bacterium]|nr:RNA polymerase sigma factor [Chloroflexota bacterium]